MTQFTVNDRRDAMGIDWMTNEELKEAIPPAYTIFIGLHLMNALKGETYARRIYANLPEPDLRQLVLV